MTPRSRLVLVLSALLALAAVLSGAAASRPTSSPAGRIVFAADRSPLYNGEIYRVDPSGRRLDLSRSPALDADPQVSPDGKQVAFVSDRGGQVAVYVVGIDGHGLRRVSPPLFAAINHNYPLAQLSWSGHGRLAAVISGSAGSAVYLADLKGGWQRIWHSKTSGVPDPLSWSRDGQLLAFTSNQDATVHVFSSSGRQLWTQVGLAQAGWSATDHLAVYANSTAIRVYDRVGRLAAGYAGWALAWSPNGRTAAVLDQHQLELRHDGVGRPSLDTRIPQILVGANPRDLTWVSASRLLIPGHGVPWISYDVVKRKPWPLPTLARDYPLAFSTGGALASPNQSVPGGARLAALALEQPRAAPRTLVTATWCGDDLPFAYLQFVPHSLALVYQSSCVEPSADLYAVNGDGSGLTQLTHTPTDEIDPSLSADGSQIVYVKQAVAERCDGCNQTIWRMPASGGAPQQLTFHTDNDTLLFDTNPSFSPDGQQVSFLRSGFDEPPTIYTLPASGGTAEDTGVVGGQATWGPQQIAYFAPSSKLVLKTYDPQTKASQVVRSGPLNADTGSLAWSEDGRLAYLIYDGHGRASITIVGSKSKPLALAPLLPEGAVVSGLAWSPDDKRFAFVASDREGLGEVYTIGVDGYGLTQLTHNLDVVGVISGPSGLSWR